DFTQQTREQLGALPTVGLNLVEAELHGLWRLPAAEQAVLAEMSTVLGADTIRVGLDSEIQPNPAVGVNNPVNQIQLRDFNLPVALTSNDSFDSRIALAGSGPLTVYGSLRNATFEAGEPSDGIGGVTPSVWWSWTAPCSFNLTAADSPLFDTIDSDFDT